QLPLAISIPAVAQGVLAIEIREGDVWIERLVRAAIHDDSTAAKMAAERAFLAAMGGSCQTPLAAHAVDRDDGGLRVYGMCGMPDGSRVLKSEIGGSTAQAKLLGQKLAQDLIAQGAREILDATKHM